MDLVVNDIKDGFLAETDEEEQAKVTSRARFTEFFSKEE